MKQQRRVGMALEGFFLFEAFLSETQSLAGWLAGWLAGILGSGGERGRFVLS